MLRAIGGVKGISKASSIKVSVDREQVLSSAPLLVLPLELHLAPQARLAIWRSKTIDRAASRRLSRSSLTHRSRRSLAGPIWSARRQRQLPE
jgi:hypothetical protein